MKKLIAGVSVVVVGLLVLVMARPFDIEPEYHYDDATVRMAVEGTWAVTIASTPPRELRISIAEAKDKPMQQHSSRSFVRGAQACSHRTFVRSAEACADDSEMPLEVHVAGRIVDGRFRVFGIEFDRPMFLDVQLGDSEGLNAMVSPIGQATEVEYYRHEQRTPATMIRTSAH